MNDGYGTFENTTADDFPAVKTGDDWGGVALALGDVDGDSVEDLVVSTPAVLVDSTGIVPTYLPGTRLFLGSSSGFTEATSTKLPKVSTDGTGDMLRAVDVTLANPEGDGDLDIFIVATVAIDGDDGQISSTRFLRNDGTGAFEDVTAKLIALTGSDYLRGHALILGDVDGDDDQDLIVTTVLAGYASEGQHPTRLLEFR